MQLTARLSMLMFTFPIRAGIHANLLTADDHVLPATPRPPKVWFPALQNQHERKQVPLVVSACTLLQEIHASLKEESKHKSP